MGAGTELRSGNEARNLAVREIGANQRNLQKKPFSGYHSRDIPPPDLLLTEVGPGTKMGEYMRRFWMPVCMSEQLGDLPHAIRILGQDLVAFRDKTGRLGVLHRHCSHRGTSLEYGVITDRGIRCCYHGWLFDVDGKILETPGEPPESKLKDSIYHGAYPAYEVHGLVFAYLGPPELMPEKPYLDFFDMPGAQFAPFGLSYNNSWLNSHENAMDPFHAVFLHGTDGQHFQNPAIGLNPNIRWRVTGGGDGMVYMSVRRLDDDWIWARMNHCIMPLQSYVPTTVEHPRPTYFTPAIYLRYIGPVDDTHAIFYGWRAHGTDRLRGPDPKNNGWNLTDVDGQTKRETYEEAQRKAGDFEAQGSIWYGLPRPDIEHRGTTDTGVVMIRKLLRDILEGDVPAAWPEAASEGGGKPKVRNILAQDSVINVKRRSGPGEDWALLTEVGEKITDAVVEGGEQYEGAERDDYVIGRIKEIENKYRG